MFSTWRELLASVLAAVLLLADFCGAEEQLGEIKSGQVTSVILVGATSDLAKKYLWKSIFKSYFSGDFGENALFVGGATRGYEEGSELLRQILQESITCDGLDEVILPDECASKRDAFIANAQYQQLKRGEDYAELSSSIQSQLKSKGTIELGRIYYLSISPDFYQGAAEAISSFGRPVGSSATSAAPWLRVVLEKPFGRDLDSARALSTALAEHLREDEMYRVDHYLGKPAVQAILPLRSHPDNAALENALNAAGVASIQVVLKESEDCAGRAGYYDRYGAIRDVHQNHLTQILALLTMTVDPGRENAHRIEVLRNLELFAPGGGGGGDGGGVEAAVPGRKRERRGRERRREQEVPLPPSGETTREAWLRRRAAEVERAAHELEAHADRPGRPEPLDMQGIERALAGAGGTPDTDEEALRRAGGLPHMGPSEEEEEEEGGEGESGEEEETGPFIWLGQYEGYTEHVAADRNTPAGFEGTATETAAGVVVGVGAPGGGGRWAGVPMLLYAGKAVDAREAYAQVDFVWEGCALRVNLHGPGPADGPYIEWDERCPFRGPAAPEGWAAAAAAPAGKARLVPTAAGATAYDGVVAAVARGEWRGALFGPVRDLHAQWAFWDGVRARAAAAGWRMEAYPSGAPAYLFEDQLPRLAAGGGAGGGQCGAAAAAGQDPAGRKRRALA